MILVGIYFQVYSRIFKKSGQSRLRTLSSVLAAYVFSEACMSSFDEVSFMICVKDKCGSLMHVMEFILGQNPNTSLGSQI